jgi:hypothetical protein
MRFNLITFFKLVRYCAFFSLFNFKLEFLLSPEFKHSEFCEEDLLCCYFYIIKLILNSSYIKIWNFYKTFIFIFPMIILNVVFICVKISEIIYDLLSELLYNLDTL